MFMDLKKVITTVDDTLVFVLDMYIYTYTYMHVYIHKYVRTHTQAYI